VIDERTVKFSAWKSLSFTVKEFQKFIINVMINNIAAKATTNISSW
tara:strand:+ start:275 stop:412 length:138 start_codon:yes stop_codon:yes gene_type:complete